MNGIALSRAFYEQYGRPMLEREFPALLPLLAVGFVGSGSEKYGFDDEISRDHDFEAGFCLFLPDEQTVDRRTAFRLERAYAHLPKEFAGVCRPALSPVGGNRVGPMRTAEFYRDKVGVPDGRLSVADWLTLPDSALAEATNGAVFFDGYGEFSAIRARLSAMPEDIRRKKLAGNLLLMEQAGPYNFSRCIAHGDPDAAQLACTEFVRAAMKVVFYLNGRYLPYYKWSFRALRALPLGAETAEPLARLLAGDNRNSDTVRQKEALISTVSETVCRLLFAENFIKEPDPSLSAAAQTIHRAIGDEAIRNLNLLAGV